VVLAPPSFLGQGSKARELVDWWLAKDLCDLNERVLCGGTKGKRRLVFFSAAEKAEHIVGCLAQVVLGVHFWEWDSMWEPVDSADTVPFPKVEVDGM
jgi:hypothetical protein